MNGKWKRGTMGLTTFICARSTFNKINAVIGYSIIGLRWNIWYDNQKDIVCFTRKDGVYFNKSETVMELTKTDKIRYANRGTVELKPVYQWSSSSMYFGKESTASLMALAENASEMNG